MDKAAQLPAKQKNKSQQHLMNKKDADLKKLLNKDQYKQYYNRERLIREREKTADKGPHQRM